MRFRAEGEEAFEGGEPAGLGRAQPVAGHGAAGGEEVGDRDEAIIGQSLGEQRQRADGGPAVAVARFGEAVERVMQEHDRPRGRLGDDPTGDRLGVLVEPVPAHHVPDHHPVAEAARGDMGGEALVAIGRTQQPLAMGRERGAGPGDLRADDRGRQRRQRGMVPTMAADLVALGGDAGDEFGMARGALADEKEGGAHPVAGQRIEHGGRRFRVRPVVEGERHALFG